MALFSDINGQMIGLWIILGLIFMVSIILQTPWFKGLVGEWIVRLVSKWFLDSKRYHLIHDMTLPTADGTTQIDHIILSRYGLFVVETKHMKGWIYGGAKQKSWTQVIYRKKVKFQNPLHQNFKHLKTLQALLGVPVEKLHSVIVFTGRSTFKTPLPANVMHLGNYVRYIKRHKEILFSEAEAKQLHEELEHLQLKRSRQTRQAHVAHVQELIAANAAQPSCPQCGGRMVLRTVRKGERAGQQLWGCVRYPSCRGIRPA